MQEGKASVNGETTAPSVPETGPISEGTHSGTDTDIDEPVVELRAPRYLRRGMGKGKGKTKNFQLFLSYPSSNTDSDSSSSVDGVKIHRRHPLLIRGSRPKTPDLEEEDKECTIDNWKGFFGYVKQDFEKGPFLPSESTKFNNEKPVEPKPLELSMFWNGSLRLAIISPYLRDQFKKVVDVENYHGITLTSSEVLLSSPFGPLFHHIEDMKANTVADPEATAADRNHMDALHYFVTTGWPVSFYNDVRSTIQQELITYDELWALFKPGDLAVSKDPIGTPSLSKITSVKLEQEPNRGYQTEFRWWVTLVKITWKAGRFWKFQMKRRIERFADAKKIKELDFYPLAYHDSGDELREAAIQRGRAWMTYNKGEPRVMSYEGLALSMTTDNTSSNGRIIRIQEDENQSDYNSLNVSGNSIDIYYML